MPRAAGSQAPQVPPAGGNAAGNSGGGFKKDFYDRCFFMAQGRLTKDPVVEHKNGKMMVKFTVARSKGEKTYFHNCVAWDKKAEMVMSFAPKKGDPVIVEFDPEESDYTPEGKTEPQKWVSWVIREFALRHSPKKGAAPAVPPAGGPSDDEAPIE